MRYARVVDESGVLEALAHDRLDLVGRDGRDNVLHEHSLEQRQRLLEGALGSSERKAVAKVRDLVLEQIAEALLDLVEFGLLLHGHRADAVRPIAVHVTGAKREAVVKESRIDDEALLGLVQQVGQVVEVTIATSHSIARLVLVQQEDLTRTEPTLSNSSSFI